MPETTPVPAAVPAESTATSSTIVSSMPVSHKKRNIIIAVVIIILLLILALLAALLLSNSYQNNTNNNSSSSSVSTSSSTSSTSSSSSTSTSSSVNAVVTVPDTDYDSTIITVDGIDYVSFDHCTDSLCSHYLLNSAYLVNYPIANTAATGQKFKIAGTLTDSPEGNAAGNQYFILMNDIKLQVLATYVDMETDINDSAQSNYVFSSCANPAPPCMKYFVHSAIVTTYPFVSTLNAGDIVALSGVLTSTGNAAGTHYYQVDNAFLELQ